MNNIDDLTCFCYHFVYIFGHGNSNELVLHADIPLLPKGLSSKSTNTPDWPSPTPHLTDDGVAFRCRCRYRCCSTRRRQTSWHHNTRLSANRSLGHSLCRRNMRWTSTCQTFRARDSVVPTTISRDSNDTPTLILSFLLHSWGCGLPRILLAPTCRLSTVAIHSTVCMCHFGPSQIYCSGSTVNIIICQISAYMFTCFRKIGVYQSYFFFYNRIWPFYFPHPLNIRIG